MMEHFIKNYFNDDAKRTLLYSLTREIYGFDFTDWYNNGYYTGEYIPYSIEIDGKIISNASANIMKFSQINLDGEYKERTYIQIGTVMTLPEYRRMGFAGRLIKEIIKDYRDNCDGIYLFANLSALDFYEDLGFWKSMHYKVSVKKNIVIEKKDADFIEIRKNKEKRENYLAMVKLTTCNSSFEQTNKFGLQMFYTGDFQNVYYSKSLNCFACYECNEKTLYLNSIIADKETSVRDVLAKIPDTFDRVIIGFTPKKFDLDIFDLEEYDGADNYRLFCMGNILKEIEENKLYFPEYSHA